MREYIWQKIEIIWYPPFVEKQNQSDYQPFETLNTLLSSISTFKKLHIYKYTPVLIISYL